MAYSTVERLNSQVTALSEDLLAPNPSVATSTTSISKVASIKSSATLALVSASQNQIT